ncbi:MAG: helix-turn-helix domain-containing protein [Verrucomicrobiales bacterium]|nr:helix-turn-helix domain-containing protein [Verrucomicrobiales bacterium]MCP5558955.1 helix-turn-helix domain-containing protein [Verrucomicrobiaceae bacterium]
MNRINSQHSKLAKHFDSSRSDFSPYGFSCELWTPTPMPRPDRHNEIEVNWLRSGSLTYLLGGRRTMVRAGRLALFWAAIPHQIVSWNTKEPYYVATLPLSWFLACGFPERFSNAVIKGELITDPAAKPTDELQFQQWLADISSKDPLQKRIAQMEIQARLLRVAHALSPQWEAKTGKSRSPRSVDPSLSRADQIACYIARNYHEPITADQIAAAVGLHPNYAMNLFRKAFGTTMVDFLVQHRLSHAQRLLATTDDPIIEIAGAAGFQSLSRFNEAFKAACGCPPREYRKMNRVK